MDWFEKLTGFREDGYGVTQGRLEIVGDRLRSNVNGQSYATGELETPSLKELRQRARIHLDNLSGALKVSCVTGSVRKMHADATNRNALFQAASQFNLLEMTGPKITPEHGVTRYAGDHTQGPACAIAAGAATIYRNYFANVNGQVGQTRDRQIDCLSDLGSALGNHKESLWMMRNGYALCDESGLAAINRALAASSEQRRDELRDLLRVGVHWNVEVTDAPTPRHVVSQIFCSALPVSYSFIAASQWRAFATLILEGTYEASLWAAALNAQRSPSKVVFLTQVGGGAFGNDHAWISGALKRALEMFREVDLDIRLVSRGQPTRELAQFAQTH